MLLPPPQKKAAFLIKSKPILCCHALQASRSPRFRPEEERERTRAKMAQYQKSKGLFYRHLIPLHMLVGMLKYSIDIHSIDKIDLVHS